MLTAAKMAKSSMMGKPLLIQASMMKEENMGVVDPNVFMKPIATILIWLGQSQLRYIAQKLKALLTTSSMKKRKISTTAPLEAYLAFWSHTKMRTIEQAIMIPKDTMATHLLLSRYMVSTPITPTSSWADQIDAPLTKMLKLNCASMRVGVRYCRQKMISTKMRIIVIMRRDLNLNRSRIVNFLDQFQFFFRIQVSYLFFVCFISQRVRSGYFMPLALAMKTKLLKAFSYEFLVIRLMGVSLKNSIKMMIRMRTGRAKKMSMTRTQLGRTKKKSTSTSAPMLNMEARTTLKYCLLSSCTNYVRKMQLRLKDWFMPIVNSTIPTTHSHRMSLRAIITLPIRDIAMPPTIITFDLRMSPTRADMKQPMSCPEQKRVFIALRVDSQEGQRQSPNWLAKEWIRGSGGTKADLWVSGKEHTQSRHCFQEREESQMQSPWQKRKGVMRRATPSNIPMKQSVMKRVIWYRPMVPTLLSRQKNISFFSSFSPSPFPSSLVIIDSDSRSLLLSILRQISRQQQFQQMTNIKLIKKSNGIVDFIVLNYIFLGLVDGTVKFFDDLRWSFTVGLRQKVVQNYCYCCQYSEKQHYFEPALEAAVDDLRGDHCS